MSSVSRWLAAFATVAVPLACVQRPAPSPAVEPVAAAVVVVEASPATPASSPPAPDPAAQPAPVTNAVGFVVILNGDTLAAERYTRTASRVTGELVMPGPGIRQTYDLTLTPSATVSRLELAAYRAAASSGDAPMQSLVARFDSAGIVVDAAGQASTIVAPPGTLPFINLSAAVVEQILLRAKALGGTSASVPILVVGGAQQTVAGVQWLGADSAVITLGPELRVRVSSIGEFLGGVVPSQNVNFVRDASAPHPTSQVPDFSAPAGAPYIAEEVQVRNEAGGVTLTGTLTIPTRSSGTLLPAVVLITGSGVQDRDEASTGLRGWRPFRQIADTLSRRGIAVLRMDDRGAGGSDPGSPHATTMDFAGDIRAAVSFLRSRPDIDPARVGLVGHSEGAQIAPIVAADDPVVRAIVMIAGPSRVGRAISDAQIAYVLDEQGITGAKRDSVLRSNNAARDAMTANAGWLRFWMDYDPLPVARRVRAPVLILQGATDRQVTADQAEELAAAVRAGGNRDVTVRVFATMNHLLVEDPNGAYSGYAKLPSLAVRADLLGLTADWLSDKLGARQTR